MSYQSASRRERDREREPTRYHDSGDRYRGAVATVASTPRYAAPAAYQYHDPLRRDSAREREPPTTKPAYSTSRHLSRQSANARPQVERRYSRDQDDRHRGLDEASEEDDDVQDDLEYSRSPPARDPRHEHEAEFGRLSRQGTKDSGYSSRSDKSTKPIQQSYSQGRHTGGNDPGGNTYSTSPAQARELAYRPSQPAPKPVYRSERQDSGASNHVPPEKPRQTQYAPDRSRHSENDESNASAYGLSKQKSRARQEHAGSRAEHTTQQRATYNASNFLKPEHGARTQDRHGRQDSHHTDDRGGYAPNSSRPRHEKVSRTDKGYREDRDRSPASEVSTDKLGRHRAPVVQQPREDDSDDGLGGGYGLSPRASRAIELPKSRHVNFAEPKERRSVSFQRLDNRDAYSGHQSGRYRVKGDDGLAGSYGLSGQRRVPEDDDGLGGAYGLRSEGPGPNDEGLGESYGVPSERAGPDSRHARREPSYRPRRS